MLKFAHMYAKNQLPNPYGRQSVDLSGIHIPAAHKEWFARDVLARNHTGVHWDTTYNLPKNTTAGWSRIYKSTGHILEPGRPAVFAEKEKR